MTMEKVLIDPMSFFSSGGPQRVAVEPPKRPLPEKENRAVSQPSYLDTSQGFMKKQRIEESSGSDFKPSRMPGVMQVSLEKLHTVEELWVEKYKPKKLNELVGNVANIGKLSNWLKGWDSKRPVQSMRPGQENHTAKAALVSGPPGIGKTSTAKLVCEANGYSVLEFNASDTRSKQAIDEMANGLSTNNVLFGNQGKMGSKVAIIMDEVDGMAGSGDRGGSGALIQLIKKSKLPVICVCNDRQDSKVRSLANHCLDLRFAKPTAQEVAARAATVAQSEGMKISINQLAELAESVSCDIRQVINHLQLSKTSGLDPAVQGQKDESMDPFQVVKGLLTSSIARTWSNAKRNELFFMDYDLIPLLVQQNYAKCIEKIVDPRALLAMKKANEFITLGDVVSRAIHTDNHWALLPEYGVLSTVAPSFACNNVLAFPEFPAWLGKQSTTGKNSRLLKELRSLIGSSSTCTSRNVKLSGYSDVLYEVLTARLSTPEGIKETIAMLDELGVSKDALFEVLSETRFPWQSDPYSRIDSKTKAAFTRSYNSGNHVVKAGNADAIRSTKRGGNQPPTKTKQMEEDGCDIDDEIDEKEDDSNILVKQAKPAKKRN
jgi:replication factor C subunit 1